MGVRLPGPITVLWDREVLSGSKEPVQGVSASKEETCYDPDILCRRIGARGTPRVRVSDRSPRAAAFLSPCHAAGDADACIHPHPPANLPLISLNLFVVTFINL